MKKVIVLFVCLGLLIGCADSMVIDGTEYESYGLLNKKDNRDEDVKYKLVLGNLIWSILLVQTVVAPIYFIGFSLYEPVGIKK